MSDRTRDRFDGTTDENTNRGNSASSRLTADDQKRVEGQTGGAKGESERRKADAKEKVDEAVEKFTGNW